MQCPLLCKEFIIDAWQIYHARSKGADAILLIAAVLPDLDIKYFTKICRMLGLAALVEVCYLATLFCMIVAIFFDFNVDLSPTIQFLIIKITPLLCKICKTHEISSHPFPITEYHL